MVGRRIEQQLGYERPQIAGVTRQAAESVEILDPHSSVDIVSADDGGQCVAQSFGVRTGSERRREGIALLLRHRR